MNANFSVQGQTIREKDIHLIRHLIRTNPGWNRTHLSRRLCHLWQWYDHAKRPRDIACRGLLLKLERRGHIILPATSRSTNGNQIRNTHISLAPWRHQPIEAQLHELMPLHFHIPENRRNLDLFKTILHHEHYLGYTDVGRNMKYIVFDRFRRPLACLLFGSAAWTLQPRDQFITWNKQQRLRNIQYLTNNLRLLIRPAVVVPNLASFILSTIARRIQNDWIEKYGYPVFLLETFVDTTRFAASAYKAANWQCLGKTKGRTRNDRFTKIAVPVKEIYAYPLTKHWRKHLLNTNIQ